LFGDLRSLPVERCKSVRGPAEDTVNARLTKFEGVDFTMTRIRVDALPPMAPTKADPNPR
jgi:hypothetical protein